MSNKPILSFCIPTFNRAQRVYNCVKNILSCESDDIQVVVSNNASTDNTLDLLNSINDPRLKIKSNKENINILNWPLVVSYADGDWAALMSDEDKVCIQNIPYFLKMLCEADASGVGVVTYSFPPIFHFSSEYTCKNQLESISMGGRHSGHITGHVVNMRYFNLGDLSEWDYAKNLYEQREKEKPPLNSFISEPQHELVLRIAQISTVLFTKISLCAFGEDHDKNRLSLKSDDLNKFDGLCFINSDHIAAALYNKIDLYHNTVGITDENSILFSTAIMSILERQICVTLDCLNSIYRGDHRYRPALFALAKQKYNYSRNDVKNKTLENLKKFIENYPPFVNEELFICLYNYLKELLNGNPYQLLTDTLSFDLRVLLGNTLQMAYLSYITYSSSKRTSRGFYTYGFFDDFNDLLEFTETHKMVRCSQKKQYGSIIENFEYIKSYRKHYLIGKAYIRKSMWEKAKIEFEKFLSVVENPKCIADIVTGSYSVQSAYYYLGYIHQKLREYCIALEYYSKCKSITENLMLEWNLNNNRLELEK